MAKILALTPRVRGSYSVHVHAGGFHYLQLALDVPGHAASCCCNIDFMQTSCILTLSPDASRLTDRQTDRQIHERREKKAKFARNRQPPKLALSLELWLYPVYLSVCLSVRPSVCQIDPVKQRGTPACPILPISQKLSQQLQKDDCR